MSRERPDRSEGVRKAYAAQRLENLSLAIAILFTVAGLFLILTTIFTPPPETRFFLYRFELDITKFYRGFALLNPVFYLGALSLALGFLAFRTTVAWEIAKQGPRLPRRMRLPFDSTVEIGVAANQVQQRTGMIIGDRRGPDADKSE
jgi:hypothetical protein